MPDALESRLLSLKKYLLLGLTDWLIQIGLGYKLLSKIQIIKIILKIYVYWFWEGYWYIHGQSHIYKNKKELKKDAAKEEYKNLIVHGWSKIVED
mgnify:CR=1 FL=1